jgi:hypothetical protein
VVPTHGHNPMGCHSITVKTPVMLGEYRLKQ